MPPRMYSPSSPVLSSLDHSPRQFYNNPQHHHHSSIRQQQGSQCLKFRYFTIFLICTTCLALLSASLATHKWIVSKPIRILKLNGGQTNLTSLMLIAQNDQYDQRHPSNPNQQPLKLQANNPNSIGQSTLAQLNPNQLQPGAASLSQSNKFQGEIYFGLFKGVKVLNYGFGDRVSPISVLSTFAQKNTDSQNNSPQQTPQQEFINFRLWLLTLVSVALAILSALIGSIFAIINFVMSPRGTLTGPVGLVIWNATSCFLCLTATVAWLVEYLVRLRSNVLTPEEIQSGWISESRSQFGYSYYLVVLAFVLHLVNIFIVSIVQFDSWTKNNANLKRLSSRPVCEGVTMLY